MSSQLQTYIKLTVLQHVSELRASRVSSVRKDPTRHHDGKVPTSKASHLSSVIKDPTRGDDRKVPTSEARHWCSVIKRTTRRDYRKVPTSEASHRFILIKHFSHYINKTPTIYIFRAHLCSLLFWFCGLLVVRTSL